MIPIPPDFKEFLKLLNARGVKYLVIGGYAVSIHGYPRPTGDLDVWVATDKDNAGLLVDTLKQFGFDVPELKPALLYKDQQTLRMGIPPVRIEVISDISGVEFSTCYERRQTADLDGVPVSVISLSDLRINKKAAGRSKDLVDCEKLPKG